MIGSRQRVVLWETEREVKPGFHNCLFISSILSSFPPDSCPAESHLGRHSSPVTSRCATLQHNIYNLSRLSPHRAETKLPAELLPHKNTQQCKDDAVNAQRSKGDQTTQVKQMDFSAQTLGLINKAKSLTFTAAQTHTANKKKKTASINLVYCFSGSRRAERSKTWFKNPLGSAVCWLLIQRAGGWQSAAKLPKWLASEFKALDVMHGTGR